MHSSLNIPDKTFEYSFSYQVQKITFNDEFVFYPTTVHLNSRWNLSGSNACLQKDCYIYFNVIKKEFDDWFIFSKLFELGVKDKFYDCEIKSFMWPEPLLLSVCFKQMYHDSLEICFHSLIQEIHSVFHLIHEKVESDLREQQEKIIKANPSILFKKEC